MAFADLKSPAGLQVLNDYLEDKSYIKGYVPSQTDVAVFKAVPGPLPADLCHALHWYNHIKSYEKEKASLPGVKKALGKYGPADVEDTTGSGATQIVKVMMTLSSLDLMRRRKVKKQRS
uniref:Elongation factor 1-beta n=1 Tax=Piliocolobus tephrosceles TaxID=591936 RepID=A0A8C9GXD1_9PRIM